MRRIGCIRDPDAAATAAAQPPRSDDAWLARAHVRHPWAAMPAPAPKFGRYVVLDELEGRGGERTLVAYDPELDRKVGLKVFPPASDGAQTRRRDRARVLAAIVHPHVVRLHDVGTYEGRLFAAMDFVEGLTIGPWIERDRPRWRRVVEVFLAAGDGLAAAHEAGLVHGHFSGHTVVVGDDGQIRVIDFVRSSPQLGPPRDEAGDRADWCRALSEALWGPVGAAEADTSSSSAVPRRVRRVIERGRRDPTRFPSTRALVDELARTLRRNRRLGVATVLFAVVAGPAIVWSRPEPAAAVKPWCEHIEARITEVWNDEAIERSHQAFIATELPFAEQSWTAVSAGVDDFVDRWRQAQVAHCEPGPDDADDRQHAATTVCLHRQYQAFRTLVDALGHADAELVTSATRTVTSLGSPAACATGPDDGARYAGVDLERVLEVESQLSRATVERDLGRYRESITAATEAHALAEALGLRPLTAEAEYRIALARANLGDEAEAERGYHDAFSSAVASGHLEYVARSTMELAVLLAEQGRHDEAERWLEHAAAAIERHDTLALQTRLAAVRGLAAYRHGHHEDARRYYEQSMALADEADPPDDFAKMHAAQALGNVLGRLGSTQEEIELLERSLAFAESKLGRHHPIVGHHLNSLATALSRRGSVDLGLDDHVRAMKIFEAAFGPDHANTIAARTSLAATLQETGRIEEAAEAYATALASAERSFDDDDPRYVTVLGNVGMFYALQGRDEEAATLLSKAAARNEAIHGADHVHTLGYLTNLAATYLFSDRLVEARAVYEKVLVRTERSLGADHPQVIPVLLGLARVETELGEPAAAVPRLERALQLSIDRDARAERIATVRFELARALWEAGIDRPRALTIAREAVQSYLVAKDGGWDIGERVEEVQAWIDAHRD